MIHILRRPFVSDKIGSKSLSELTTGGAAFGQTEAATAKPLSELKTGCRHEQEKSQ